MLKKPSILACLCIYCSVFKDFALFAWTCVVFLSFAESRTQSETRGDCGDCGHRVPSGGALLVTVRAITNINILKETHEFFSNL